MEAIYRGYEIVQPTIFKRKLHTIGSGTTSIKVRTRPLGEDPAVTLKTMAIPRYDVKALEAALDKAKQFIDDLHLVGTTVKIKRGEFKGLLCSIDSTERRRVQKKSILYLTVNLPGENTPPFETFTQNELIFL